MGKGTEVLDNARLLPAASREKVAAVPCVSLVRAVVFAVAPVVKPSGALDYVEVVGVEAGGPVVPWNLERGAVGDLDAELRVAIDEHDREKLQTGDDPMGAVLDVGGRKAVVAGVTRGIRSFALYPYVFSHVDNARKLAGASPGDATFWVADVGAGADAGANTDANTEACVETLRAALTEEKLDVHRTGAFASLTERYWVWGSGAGAAIAFSAAFSLVIGAIIVGQTLYSITREHLLELATLKAMGASAREIVSFVAWQAAVLGAVGGLLGLALASSLRSALSSQGIEIVLSAEVLAVTAASVVLMCGAASVPCVRRVLSVEAAEVFR
jgi:putative ABC transport system permease protein